MRRMTLGRLLLDRALPEDMRGRDDLVLDKKGVANLFDELARRHPEKYREVAKALTDVGRDVAQATGGFSFALNHLSPSPAGEQVKARLRQELDAIHRNPAYSPEVREKAVTDLLARYQKPLESAVFDESKAEGNPLAHQVENVGRGNKAGLKGLRSGDLLYEDHHGRPIPIPVLNSYSHGLDPAEYFRTADRATAVLHIPSVFAAPRADQHFSPAQILAAFGVANPALPPHAMTVACSRNELSEVRLCLTRGLLPRPCGRGVRDSCPAAPILVRAVR